MKYENPLLTIAIPTFNRVKYLRQCLDQLRSELNTIDPGTIEVLVSDNFSTDDTQALLSQTSFSNASFRWIRQSENIGSDKNIAACFAQARGTYVCVMGDDDLPIDGTLKHLLKMLVEHEPGVVYLKAFGFERDFRIEKPNVKGTIRLFKDSNKFIGAVAQNMTFISSCVINKSTISDVNPMKFCGSNLVQVNLVILAALRSKVNIYWSSYVIAALRNNSGGYNFFDVFVKNFFGILDSYIEAGLKKRTIIKIENKMLLSYYPFYILTRLKNGNLDRTRDFRTLYNRFKKRILFWTWIAPTMILPRPLALPLSALSMTLGRVFGGDFRRGASFLLMRFSSKERKPNTPQ